MLTSLVNCYTSLHNLLHFPLESIHNNIPINICFLQGSGPASGILTPSAEALRSMSPDPNPPASFQELLSALQGLGEVRSGEAGGSGARRGKVRGSGGVRG